MSDRCLWGQMCFITGTIWGSELQHQSREHSGRRGAPAGTPSAGNGLLWIWEGSVSWACILEPSFHPDLDNLLPTAQNSPLLPLPGLPDIWTPGGASSPRTLSWPSSAHDHLPMGPGWAYLSGLPTWAGPGTPEQVASFLTLMTLKPLVFGDQDIRGGCSFLVIS